MELLHFDTENRKAIVVITRTELLDMDAQLLGRGQYGVSRTVTAPFGEVEVRLEEDR